MKMLNMKNYKKKLIPRIFFRLSLIAFLLAGFEMSYGQQKDFEQFTFELVDSDGNAISGADVYFQNGTKRLKSDANGLFTLRTYSNDVLFITSDNYETKYVDLIKTDLSKEIELTQGIIMMRESDEITVPYGKLPGRMITGAVSKVDVRKLRSYPTLNNVVNSMAGKEAGLYVSQNNATPGWGGSTVRLRGLHSSGGNAPVTFVDGIERPINELNIEEIESIHLLKDITAKIFAGPKAINGVIWVETRRGQAFKREIDVNVEYGIRIPTALPEYLNSYDYANLYNEARINDGMSIYYSEEVLEGYLKNANPILYPDNDLYNDFLSDQMNYTRINSQISGGDDKSRYFVDISYLSSEGLEKVGDKIDYNKVKMRGNLDVKLTDVTSLQIDINGMIELKKWPNMNTGNFFDMLSMHRPNEYPYFLNEFESIDSAMFGASYEYNNNIYGEMTQTGSREDFNRLGQTNLGLNFDLNQYLEGLSAKAYMTYDSYNYIRYRKGGGTYDAYIPRENGDSLIYQKVNSYRDVTGQTLLHDDAYRRFGTYGKVSFTNEINNLHYLNADLMARYNQTELKLNDQIIKNMVFAFRTNYMFKKKYAIEANLAYYGSPRFKEKDRFRLFPALGVGWIISEEPFLTGSSIVDFLKIKGSWGIMGTDGNVNSYPNEYAYFHSFRDVWRRSGNHSFGLNNENNVEKINYITAGNPAIGWEESREINIGIEGFFFSERLFTKISYFNELRSGIVVRKGTSYPIISGSLLPWENYEEVSNKGVELSLSFSDQIRDFTWSFGVNGIFSQSEYKVVDEPDYPFAYMKEEGQPISAEYGLVADGLFIDEDDIANSPLQMFGSVKPGDIKYKDLNNDGVINNEDIQKIGGSFPDLTYGVDLSLGYKGFSLYIAGFGVRGLNSVIKNRYYWVRGEAKYPAYLEEERWTPETAETAIYPRLTTKSGANNFQNSKIGRASCRERVCHRV